MRSVNAGFEPFWSLLKAIEASPTSRRYPTVGTDPWGTPSPLTRTRPSVSTSSGSAAATFTVTVSSVTRLFKTRNTPSGPNNPSRKSSTEGNPALPDGPAIRRVPPRGQRSAGTSEEWSGWKWLKARSWRSLSVAPASWKRTKAPPPASTMTRLTPSTHTMYPAEARPTPNGPPEPRTCSTTPESLQAAQTLAGAANRNSAPMKERKRVLEDLNMAASCLTARGSIAPS